MTHGQRGFGASARIPVVGHLGLTPRSVSALGGFRLQGKGAIQAKKIVDDAKALGRPAPSGSSSSSSPTGSAGA
jgi:hypothetical protein